MAKNKGKVKALGGKSKKREQELREYNQRIEREKASGKSQKPVTVLNKNEATFRAWEEDRPKALASKIGSPRKADAQIIYENKKFNKRKKTKDGGNFDWDGKMLKGLSKKAYGKTYAEKFETLANEAGIPKAERGAFKDYLDAKEYKANTTAGYDNAKFNMERDADKVLKKNQAEQKAIKNETKVGGKSQLGKGDKGVFGKSMDFLASLTAFDDKGYQRSQEEKKKAGVERSELDRLATRTVNSANFGIPAQLQKRATGEQADYQEKRDFGEGGGSDVLADMLGYVAPGAGLVKAGRLLGVGADLTKGALTGAGMLTRAKEGAQIGLAMSGAEVAGREALNPDDYNWKQNAGQIALETAGGALLDPLVDMIGPLAKKGMDKSMQDLLSNPQTIKAMNNNASKSMEDLASSDVFTKIMNDSVEVNPRRNMEMPEGSSMVNDPITTRLLNESAPPNQFMYDNATGPSPQQGLPEPLKIRRPSEPLGQEVNIEGTPLLGEPPTYQPKYDPNADMDEKIAYWKDPRTPLTESDLKEIGEYEKYLKDEMNLIDNDKDYRDGATRMLGHNKESWNIRAERNKSEEGAKAFNEHLREATGYYKHEQTLKDLQEIKSPSGNIEQKIARWKDPNIPRTNDDVQEIYRAMQDLEAKANTQIDLNDMSTMSKINDIAKNDPELRKVESDFTDAKLKLSNLSSTLDSWNHTKEMQALYKEKPEWMKFAMPEPERLSGDYDVPKRFLVSNKHKGGLDIFSASEQAGFGGDIDAFVDHLKSIDFHVGRRKKDIVPAQMNAKWVKEQTQRYTQGEEILKARLRQEMGIDPNIQSQIDELATLMTPYEPPTNAGGNPLEFKRSIPMEEEYLQYSANLDPKDRIATRVERTGQAEGPTETPYEFSRKKWVNKEVEAEWSEVDTPVAPEQRELYEVAVTTLDESPSDYKGFISKGTPDEKKGAKRIAEITSRNNPVSKFIKNFRQNYISGHSNANYMERHLLDNKIKNLSDSLRFETNPEAKASLKSELNATRKLRKKANDTGQLQMALENESAYVSQAETFLNDKFKKFKSIDGATMSEMVEWQVANRWKWLRDNGREVEFPEGAVADFERILASDKPAYRQSEALFTEIRDEMLDVAERSGRISPEERALLSEEPYYISFARDKSYKTAKQDNLSKGLDDFAGGFRKRTGEFGINRFDEEDTVGTIREYLANPIETMVGRAFSDFRASNRNDTALQLKSLASMDEEKMFVKMLDEKEFNRRMGAKDFEYIKGFDNGQEFYVEIHPEIARMLDSNDMVSATDKLQAVTNVYSKLKTTSVEFLMRSIPRDLITGYLNSEIRNPIKYANELWKSATDQATKQVDASGIRFKHGFNPQTAGNEMSEQVIKELQDKYKIVDGVKQSKSASKKIEKLYDIITTPQRFLGQVSDDLPRRVEANVVKERWEREVLSQTRAEIDDLAKRLETAPKGDFEQGNTSQLEEQMNSLRSRLMEQERAMNREMLHRGRDVMNYQRHGAGGFSKMAKKYINFANTTTQSKDKMARSFMRDPLGSTAKYAGYYGFFGGITALAYDSLDGEGKHQYDSLPNYMKQQSFVVPLGNEEYLVLPKSQELGIIGNFGESAIGIQDFESAKAYALKELTPYQLGNVTQAFADERADTSEDRTAKEVLTDMTVPSNAFSPLLDIKANKKMGFNDKPISYNSDGESDTYTMDFMADLLGGSDTANYAQYGAMQYGGDPAKYGLNLLDALIGRSPEDTGNAVRHTNPLQDYFYTPSTKGAKYPFKKMHYDNAKLEN